MLSSQDTRCLVCGSINIDEFFHLPAIVQPGQTLSSTIYQRRAGGKGANQAVAVARAGAPVTLIGAVGVDGGWLLEGLTAFGVDTSKISSTDNEPTGRAIIQLTPEGENSIILHKGANYTVSIDLTDVQYTHLLLQNEIPFDTTLCALQHAFANQRKSFFNPSPLPTEDQVLAFPWHQLTWLVVNEGEANDLLEILNAKDGQSVTPNVVHEHEARHYPSVVDQAKRRLLQLHSHSGFSTHVSIICTLGAAGVCALFSSNISGEETSVLHVPAASMQPGTVRDTTGAGDCFTGYFVAGMMDSHNTNVRNGTAADCLVRILQRCVQAAGLCVQRLGAMESIPCRGDVDSLCH